MSATQLDAVTSAPSPQLRIVQPPRWTPFGSLTRLWRHRALVPYFGRRYLERRYARTILGWVWIPLRPTLDVCARVLLFGGFLGVASGDRPYFMFFIVGMAAWQLFERSAFWAMRAIEMNRTLLSRVHVSRLTPVVSAVIPGALDFLLYMGIAAVGAVYYRLADGASYIALDFTTSSAGVGLFLLGLYALGFGLFLAPLAAEARDVRFFARYLFGFWFFLTPIVYPISTIPPQYRKLAELNPLTAPVELVKYGFLRTAPPSSVSLTVSLVTLVILLAAGLWFFARREQASTERI
jgi:lipopolysaccharide transport system permease protein